MGWMFPVYKWMQALKEDVMCKLGKSNIQSLNPMFQLVQVRQDVWDLVLELGQPAKLVKGRSHKLKPLTSITTFHLLAGPTNDEKLQLLSTLYKGDLNVSKVKARAWELKVHKQVDTDMPVKKIIRLLGKNVYHKEVECWTNAFS